MHDDLAGDPQPARSADSPSDDFGCLTLIVALFVFLGLMGLFEGHPGDIGRGLAALGLCLFGLGVVRTLAQYYRRDPPPRHP